MIKRRLKSNVGLFLLILMSLGLTITTLHSHHRFDWNHPHHLADTGNCMTSDAAFCPICGYVFKGNVSPVVQATEVFQCIYLLPSVDEHFIAISVFIPVLGRAPPALA